MLYAILQAELDILCGGEGGGGKNLGQWHKTGGGGGGGNLDTPTFWEGYIFNLP